MLRLTAETIMAHGELLGYCSKKGFVYSVFRGEGFSRTKGKAYREYSVVSVQNNRVSYLIDHKVYS